MNSVGKGFLGATAIPLVAPADSREASAVAEKIRERGATVVEVALRSDASMTLLEDLAVDDTMIVGAGTVITTDQVDWAVDHGARFIFTPGLDLEIVARSLARGVTVVPGVATATEVQRAVAIGLGTVKLFPISVIGGIGLVRAFAGPFPYMGLIPSGGITAETASEYLKEPNVCAVAGTWMLAAGRLTESESV